MKMDFVKTSIVLATCIVLCLSHPTPSKDSPVLLPVLKDQPAEVRFKADNYSTALLECAVENDEKDIKYTWYKDGEPFDWEAAGHIGQRQGEGSIMFFHPQVQDAGTYQCFAQTSAGIASTRPIIFKDIFLNVPKVETKIHKPVFGKPYKLECQIPESYPKPTIVWKTQLRSDPKVTVDILDRRITLSPDGTLWFSNITESDISPSFKYVCFGESPAVKGDVVLAEHFLQELTPNKEPITGELEPQYLSDDMIAKVGNVTMFYCIYGGTPLGFPDWYKDGKLIKASWSDRVTDHNRTSGKRLIINGVIPEDEGTYTCEVHNGVGKKMKHTMKLTVDSDPKFIQKIDKQLDAVKTHDVKIPCQVTGVPEPKITWTYNGKPLSNANYKNGILTLSNVKKSDTGYYGCKAENVNGIIYTETLVNVA